MTEINIDRPVGGVLRILMNGPETLNALDDSARERLLDALESAATDPEARVVLLTGQGKAFSAGGDVRNMAGRSLKASQRVLRKGQQIVEVISGMQKPVIAAVNGIASGAGFNLALAADIILADRKAWFQQSFAKLGLMPDMGGTYFLTRQIGRYRAKEVLLTGRKIGAEEAAALGFVSRVIEDDFDRESIDYCAALAQGAPVALGLTKLLTNRAADGQLSDALDKEMLGQCLLYSTEDHQEALRTFLAKGDLLKMSFSGQ
ncbi:MAG: enoyl-CoA hydratase/isomerase family protein [Actinomycetota bacterium]